MVDEDARTITLRRSTVIRVGIAVAVLAALGVGLAIGLSVGSNSSPPAKFTASATTTAGHPSTTATTTVPTTTTTAAPATTTTSNPALHVLSPQTTPPVSDECSIPLTYSADGNAMPFLCPNGGVNVFAWNDYASNHLLVMGLGTGATPSEVLNAMCSQTNTTNPIESSAEELAAAYNGWTFGNDSEFTEFLAQNCPSQ